MNSKRVYYILLGIIAVLLVGLLGGAYGVNLLFQSKSQHLVDLKLQDAVLANQQVSLVQAKKQVQKYSQLNTIAKTIVPQDKDQAEAVREITNLAASSGLKQLSSITFPQSTLGGLNNVSPSGTTSTTAAGKANLTQLIPVKGVSGVYQLQITIQQTSDDTVPYSEFISFLQKLEQNRRTAQVVSISLTPDTTDSSKVGFTLVINEFIRP